MLSPCCGSHADSLIRGISLTWSKYFKRHEFLRMIFHPWKKSLILGALQVKFTGVFLGVGCWSLSAPFARFCWQGTPIVPWNQLNYNIVRGRVWLVWNISMQWKIHKHTEPNHLSYCRIRYDFFPSGFRGKYLRPCSFLKLGRYLRIIESILERWLGIILISLYISKFWIEACDKCIQYFYLIIKYIYIYIIHVQAYNIDILQSVFSQITRLVSPQKWWRWKRESS